MPNAPLAEVIFEIRWNSDDKTSLDQFQLLLGSMFAELKSDFPQAITLRPEAIIPINAFLGIPTHRFTSNKGYPMYQLGPGVLSVNMVGTDYVWEAFLETIKKVAKVFNSLSELQGKKVTITLKYLDFFKCNFSEINLADYIKTNFHLTVDAPYLNDSKAKTFSFATMRDIEQGHFTMTMNTGYNNVKGKQIEGIITESNIASEIPFEELTSYIDDKLPMAHEYLGKFFKKMTEGELYESFE